jgi:hypothetical protein
MNREQQIPLFLWIATAVLVHLLWGGGAQQVSKIIDERLDVERFVRSVSSRVRLDHQAFEVTLEEQPEEPKPSNEDVPEANTDPDTPTPPDVEEPSEKHDPTHQATKEEQKKELEQKKEPKKEEKKIVIEKIEPVKPIPAEPAAPQKRVAVEQHVKDENQTPNPNAEFIGDHDNHVAEQTQAKITSTEQNDPKPNPGASHAGPSSEPGNAQVDEVAQAEDRAGNPDRAPGEKTNGTKEYSAAAEPPASGTRAKQAAESRGSSHGRAATEVDSRSKAAGQESRGERVASRPVESAPDLATANGERDSVLEAREARAEQKGRAAQKRRLPPPAGSSNPINLLGLGARGTTANGINLNLTNNAALATVGPDQLAKQIVADGERRRSAHRGSWRTSGLERWRSAIENYVPHVKPGNQTALNTALVPFASYLNRIHNRLHPIFADQFLAHLDEMPSGSPLGRLDMHTDLEIVLSRIDGSIVDMGVTKPSGVTAFDIGALDSVSRAAPFGAPPKAIISPDGNVYLHWEFYRDPQYACSTYFAHPKMLRSAPKSAPTSVPPAPGPFGPEESPMPNGEGQREGNLLFPLAPALRRLATADNAY